MAIRGESSYNATVGPNAKFIQSGKGTPGFQLWLRCPEGDIEHTIWLTPKSRDRAAKDFATLGVTEEQLQSRHYLQNQLSFDIEGREVCFGTKTETYNGTTSVKVAWIGRKRAGSDDALVGEIASFFGSGASEPSRSHNPFPEGSQPADDDDIPF